MSPELSTPAALKLHAFGLRMLQDPNWTGMELYDRVKQHVRRRIEPKDLLRRTLEHGLLYHLGLWLFDDLFCTDDLFHVADGEYLVWSLEDFVEMLTCAGVPRSDPAVRRVSALVGRLDDLYGPGDKAWYHAIEEQRFMLRWWFDTLGRRNSELLGRLAPAYAADYADRVFHDRQLCAYIAKLLVTIGFDGNDDDTDGSPQQWVKRYSIPAWARRAVFARDRGCCALCSAPLLLELPADEHIDHIVPLAQGGTNDLLNLQLLCEHCNRRKSSLEVPVKSSIPPYIRRRILRGVA